MEGSKDLIIIPLNSLGKELTNQILKWIEVVNTNAQVRWGIYTLAGLISLLALVQPEEDTSTLKQQKLKKKGPKYLQTLDNPSSAQKPEGETQSNETTPKKNLTKRSSWFGFFRRPNPSAPTDNVVTSVHGKEQLSSSSHAEEKERDNAAEYLIISPSRERLRKGNAGASTIADLLASTEVNKTLSAITDFITNRILKIENIFCLLL
jgi:hypothetical protein